MLKPIFSKMLTRAVVVFVLINVVALVVLRISGCSVEKDPGTEGQVPPPVTDGDGGGDEGGDDGAPAPQKPRCDEVVTFDELAPVVALNCTSCHSGWDAFGPARSRLDSMIDRIKRPQGTPGHMPAGKPSLAAADIARFEGWKAGGYLQATDCVGGDVGGGEPVFIDFATVETTFAADIQKFDEIDRENVRWLSAIDLVNLGRQEDLAIARQAANKTINSISTERELQQVVEVAPGLWRIDLEELGINAAEWQRIENSSLLQFESFTATGLFLKQVTKARLPWLPLAEFQDVVLRNATRYYDLVEAPATFQQLTAQLGVDFAGDLADRKAFLNCFNGSPLSPLANRMISRHDSDDGSFYSTYDTGFIVRAEQNCFAFPLLKEAGGRANFQFAAGESLYSLPNGMLAGFLSDAAGRRLDFADPAVVSDFNTHPLRPFIRNYISCVRCHAPGLLNHADEVRPRLEKEGLPNNAADTQIALALFKPQVEWDEQFNEDNDAFVAPLKAIGVDTTAPDPISRISDRFLGDLRLEDIAAFYVLTPDQFRTCLNLSDAAQSEAAQLLAPNGSLAHDQWISVNDDILRDCRIFQEAL
jgi:hypothetical protein